MKKIKFLAMALAAITMFSCSKENELENLGNNDPGEKSAITIKITGEGNVQSQSASRAAGAAAATETEVNDYIVFLFRAGGVLDCPPRYQADDADVKFDDATTAAKTAYVVANTGTLVDGLFKAVRNEDELKAITDDLMSAANTSSQTDTNLWMSGTGDIKYGTDEAAKKGTVTVQLGFVAAKIELIVKDNRKNMDGPDITIADNEVVLLNAGKTGRFFGTNRDVQTDFYSGDISYTLSPVPTVSTALSDAIGISFTDNPDSDIFNHFYTFGNDGATKPTILAIKSTRIVDSGIPATIYYPVLFTVDDAGSVIAPGSKYTVTITLNGDVNAGGGGGTTDPEIPVIGAEVVVEIVPAAWDPVIVNKDFN